MYPKKKARFLCIQNTENFLSVFVEYKESNSFPFLCENGWNNFISLCLRGKQSNCFPGKHELYMYSNPVFLEYRDRPQQCRPSNIDNTRRGPAGLICNIDCRLRTSSLSPCPTNTLLTLDTLPSYTLTLGRPPKRNPLKRSHNLKPRPKRPSQFLPKHQYLLQTPTPSPPPSTRREERDSNQSGNAADGGAYNLIIYLAVTTCAKGQEADNSYYRAHTWRERWKRRW